MTPDFVIKGKKIFLTRTEREIYNLLDSDRKKYFSTTEIEKKVWGAQCFGNIAVVYIKHLRNKLGQKSIENRHGYGYCLIGF